MIRKITDNDLTRIYDLGNKYDNSFHAKYDLEAYLNNDIYFLNCYEDESIIKGFIICTNLNGTFEVLLVYVDKEFRQNKIGQKLMQSIEEAATDIVLEVSTLNIPALSLYKKLGFKEIGQRPKYYNGIDALVMKKVLK